MTMTRSEAIGHLVELSDQVAQEFCVGVDEARRLDQQTTDALVALGVSPAELEEVGQ